MRSVLFFALYLVLFLFLLHVAADSFVGVDSNGDFLVETDGARVVMTPDGGTLERNLAHNGRPFGGLIVLKPPAPTLRALYGHNGASLVSVELDRSTAARFVQRANSSLAATVLELEQNMCSLRLSYGGPLSKPPICVFQIAQSTANGVAVFNRTISSLHIMISEFGIAFDRRAQTVGLARFCGKAEQVVVQCATVLDD